MLSQATGYAVSALAYIAAMGGKPALVRAIAEACDAPAAYLAKIVNTLSHRNLVVTQRGVGGGVSLARAPQDITLRELCVALDDPIIQPRCILGNAQCTSDRACPAHDFCTTRRRELGDFLQQTTIADIAAFETGRRWRVANVRMAAQQTDAH
jgi:Rrf2 family transcriptional regulator, iron-sulfur cluster assembly transcription factor